MTILFQNYSIINTLLMLWHIVRARTIVFFRPCFPVTATPGGRRKQLVEKIIRFVNPAIEIVELEQETVNRLGWQNNFESDRYIEDVFQLVQSSPSYAVMRSLIGDEHIDRFYKRALLPYVLRHSLFYRTAQHFLEDNRPGYAVPERHDLYGLHRYFLSAEERARVVPRVVRFCLFLWSLLFRMTNIILLASVGRLLVLSPLRFVLGRLFRRGLTANPQLIRTDVIMPLIWGFTEDGVSNRTGIKTSHDNSYILGGSLQPSHIAFYFSSWKFSPEEKQVQIERMQRRGLRYFDPSEFELSHGYLKELAELYRRLARLVMARPAILFEDARFAGISRRLFITYLGELHFCRSVHYKVALVYSDYNPAHVVRTIVANKFGRLTVGMHHGAPAGPYVFPNIRYTHINRHCLWGEEFKRLHGSHWDHMQSCAIGAYRVDFIVSNLCNGKLEDLRARYEAIYGPLTTLISIQFPTLSDFNLASRRNELLEGLKLLTDIQMDLRIVCRFRSVEQARGHMEIGLGEIVNNDPRILVDLSNFTTYEWVALSDVVISNSHSTGLIEAASAGKYCFTFDYMGSGELVFAKYGKDMVLKDRTNLVRVIENTPTRFQGFDCRWDLLVEDYNYFSDGDNLKRYRHVIIAAVQDVDQALCKRI